MSAPYTILHRIKLNKDLEGSYPGLQIILTGTKYTETTSGSGCPWEGGLWESLCLYAEGSIMLFLCSLAFVFDIRQVKILIKCPSGPPRGYIYVWGGINLAFICTRKLQYFFVFFLRAVEKVRINFHHYTTLTLQTHWRKKSCCSSNIILRECFCLHSDMECHHASKEGKPIS